MLHNKVPNNNVHLSPLIDKIKLILVSKSISAKVKIGTTLGQMIVNSEKIRAINAEQLDGQTFDRLLLHNIGDFEQSATTSILRIRISNSMAI